MGSQLRKPTLEHRTDRSILGEHALSRSGCLLTRGGLLDVSNTLAQEVLDTKVKTHSLFDGFMDAACKVLILQGAVGTGLEVLGSGVSVHDAVRS